MSAEDYSDHNYYLWDLEYDPNDYNDGPSEPTFRFNARKKDNKVNNTQRLRENQFYIGSNSVLQVKNRMRGSASNYGTWGHPTIDLAIRHAQQLLNDEPDKDSVFIVQIIKVVKRQSSPIVVEDI